MTDNSSNSIIEAITNPFPGLRPFRFGESHIFFGRENQVGNVVTKLRNNQFVAIIGASGVGKSSFMSCGVLSDILKDNALKKGNKWEVFTTTPGNNPMLNLAKSLFNGINSEAPLTDEPAKPDEDQLQHLFEQLSESELGLINVLKERNADKKINYLLFIDQFEEVFRFPPEDLDANQSVKNLIDLMIATISQSDLPVYIVISIRSDFIGDCARFPELTAAINSSQYLIPQLTKQEKQEAIEGPIHYMGASIEGELVHKILEDVGESADQLPVMQHALMRTWDYWKFYKSESETITLSDYEAIGGMKNALSEHAREAFRDLNEQERVICERIFKALTEKGEEGRGVRRPTSLKDITEITNAVKSQVIRVIEYFRMPGRSLLLPPTQVALDDNSMIDISHESLMRNWVELVEWVDEESESVKLYLRLAEAASMHQEGKAGLWRPPDLLLAQNWRTEQNPTQAWGLRHHKSFERTMLFLDHSEKEYERNQRIKEKLQKRRIAVFRRIAAVMFLLCLVAGWFWISANEQRNAALVATELAKEEGERAKRQKEIAEENEEKAKTQEQIAIQQTGVAQFNAKLALQQKILAEEERIKALQQESIASYNAKIAIMSEREATGLRLLSTAKSMAIKSIQIADPDVKGLVAKQAFNFNRDQNGKTNDPDIYDGLYYALKAQKSPDYFNLEEHDQNVRSLVASNNSGKVYSTGSDGKIIEWNSTASKPGARLINNNKGLKINKSMAISHDDALLATGGDFRHIEIFDLKQKEQNPKKVPTTWNETWYLGFTKDKDIITVGSNNQIMLYKNNLFRPVSGGAHKINALALHPIENSIVAAQNNGELVKYNLDTRDSTILYKNPFGIFSVSYSKNGRYLALGDEKGRVILIDQVLTNIKLLPGHTARINNIAFSHDGQKLATGSFDKTVRVWNLKMIDDAPIILRDHKDWVWSIIFNKDDSKLWAGSRDYLIRIWPINTNSIAEEICENLKRNKLNEDEWKEFAGDDFAEADTIITCQNYNALLK